MIGPVEFTYYLRTGYSFSDEPASDAVIEMNEHWAAQLQTKEYDAGRLGQINVQLTDDELREIDYLKARSVVSGERFYYFVAGYVRRNEKTVTLNLVRDNFASVGLINLSFYGNVTRRSLSASEKANYPLLPEPWAPRRPLKTRRMILDVNVNKTIVLPSHISTQFEESSTEIEKTETIDVPNSLLGLTTFSDSLSVDATLAMGYPNAAADTTHTISTPWGSISYVTPYEEYLKLSGSALATFLRKAKTYNALDLLEPPYYIPNPAPSQTIVLPELSNAKTKNLKASKFYTTVTIRSLASGASQTYSDTDTNLQYNQTLVVAIAPDKAGGIYVIPSTIRDTGLSVYTYMSGVYSPFETVAYNAVGDTPGKFAADGTLALNAAMNNLFQSYINKVNALQTEGMQAKYFKDAGSMKGAVMMFLSEVVGNISTTTTTTAAQVQTSEMETQVGQATQTVSSTQSIPSVSQTVSTKGTNGAHTDTQTASIGRQTSKSSTTNYYSGGNLLSSITSGDLSSRSDSVTLKVGAQTIESTSTNATPSYRVTTTGQNVTGAYRQSTTQTTNIPQTTTTSVTQNEGSIRTAGQGNDLAIEGVPPVYEIDSWDTLKTLVFGGFRNEVHSFMLGNINDYLNRWVSLQNDMHNGKVANLFKNITLVGGYSDYNKMAGKYEILVASLQPEDEENFDLFLDHFGHATDEYTTTLVKNVNHNYNYVMIGEDAILANNVMQDANEAILNQFRTGVRVWNVLIRPENY